MGPVPRRRFFVPVAGAQLIEFSLVFDLLFANQFSSCAGVTLSFSGSRIAPGCFGLGVSRVGVAVSAWALVAWALDVGRVPHGRS